MSYYRPTFSQTMAMSRGRGFSTSRSSYRGSSNRGSSVWSSSRGGGYSSGRGGGGGRFPSFSSSYDSRSKYPGSSERYSGSRVHDDYRKPYRPDSVSGYSSRDRSPDRKRIRTESLSSRHDGGFSSSGEYGRYESSGYPERRSFSSDRRSASFSRREEFRKPPPPPSGSPRGGYRGRISSRGSLRSRLRERPARRRLIDSSYVVRRRLIARSSDYARRLKMSRLRSAVVRRTKRKLSDKDESDDEEKEENEEKAENTEKEEEKGEGEEDKTKTTPKSTQRNEGSPEKTDKKSDSESDEKIQRRQFIKLVCPHCQTKSATFGRYSLHLQSGRHMAAMRRVALKQKSILSRMRLAQRIAQREVEKTTDDLAPRTNFCPLCKLNYKQPKSTHQATESHKNMKKFLMPYCKTCKITFKSPMLYESHTASIEHIKRKALSSDKSDKEDVSGDEDNLENFMTIDSVGDVDDDEQHPEKKKEIETKPKEQINVGIENVRKIEVYYCDLCRMYLPRAEEGDLPKILAKHCRQRTHLQRYVRYKEDKDLAKHAERLQRKETAEKEKEKEKDEIKQEPDENAEKKDPGSKENGDLAAAEEEDAGEEKLWADVDKDLGDILAEAGSGNKSSDEDEDSVANGERYDRFKLSEKNADEKKIKTEEKTETKGEVADEKRGEGEKVEEKK